MVAVIVVNWNSGSLLRQCLEGLDRQKLAATQIIVIDNGSTDNSLKGIEGLANVDLRMLGVNYGFAGGNNRALDSVDTEFVALLNPDAFPEPDWLEKLLEAARNHPDIAAFGSRQMIYQGKDVVDGVGDVYHLSGLVWRRGHGVPLSELKQGQSDIFSPCAGAALYRTEAIKSLGGFDEDFFCYVEDVDLGFRLRLAGYSAMYVPDAVVHHVGSATTGGQHSDFAVFHGHRNLVWTYVKNMPGWIFWVCLPLHLAMNVAAIGWFVFRGQGGVILKAKRDAVLGLPRMWRKRREIQARRRATVMDIWRVLDKRLWLTKN